MFFSYYNTIIQHNIISTNLYYINIKEKRKFRNFSIISPNKR